MEKKVVSVRVKALRGFALTQTVITVLGYSLLGFESSVMTCVYALLAAYACQIVLRFALIWEGKADRSPFTNPGSFIDFLLPAHIVALTVNFFIYGGDRVGPTVMAVLLAICSKHLLLVKTRDRWVHFFNPANFGILATLVLFPSISISLPYQFHSGLSFGGDIVLPLAIFVIGTATNLFVVQRFPIVLGWVGAFLLQAFARTVFFDTNFLAAIAPATGTMGMLFTFYMITDPMTTPKTARSQLVFGATIGLTYGILMASHVVYGLFWAVFLTCVGRGVWLLLSDRGLDQPTIEAEEELAWKSAS